MDSLNEEKYRLFSDEELVNLINSSDATALQVLIKKYMPVITVKASKFCNGAGDNDDYIQEGIIALYSAAKVYNSESASFAVFAGVCIDRALVSYFRKRFRKKQVPTSALVYFEDNADISGKSTPEADFIEKEECAALIRGIKDELSHTEYKVLLMYLEGNAYDTIADKLGLPVRAVTNSMYRTRRKIELLIK